MSGGQQQSQTVDSGGATPQQQDQTNWRSLADAAANIPNTMYVSRAADVEASGVFIEVAPTIGETCNKLRRIKAPTNDSSEESMAEAMEKAVEGVNLHIPGRCQENDVRDDAAKNGSDAGGDSFIQQSADFDVCTQLYASEDSCSQLYADEDSCPQPYANEHSCTQLYGNEDPCIQLYAIEESCTHPYASEDACIQLYADAYQKHGEDDKGSHLATAHGTTVGETSPMTRSDSGEDDIQPYAVKNQEDDDDDRNDSHLATAHGTAVGETSRTTPSDSGDDDIQPYAVGNSKQTVENVSATGFSECCASAETSMTASVPTLSASTKSSQEIAGRKLERITFGKTGNKPGEFKSNFGVAVSADNEIFVTDFFNKRIQVFSMKGTFLRLFPTMLPGESSRMPMYTSSVAFDVNPEYLWVLGFATAVKVNGHVVLYSRNGRPVKTFDVRFVDRNPVQYPVIAMDTRNNKVIVGEGNTIRMFHPNGTLYRCINTGTPRQGIMGVTSDREGNILLTDGYKTVMVYSPSGDKIFQFGTFGRNMGQLNSPKSVCVGASGRIIVANSGNNRVDMFGRSGEFVRTIGNVTKPWGIAMGPDGDVVVTSPHCRRGGPKVSIFPGHMVFL
ncbi:hypothetical protein Bbelb_157400 [Branchiostoma belcheri]|nr:hypothetical protein Bbelb_157400 [Branchiostoma belcheri]